MALDLNSSTTPVPGAVSSDPIQQTPQDPIQPNAPASSSPTPASAPAASPNLSALSQPGAAAAPGDDAAVAQQRQLVSSSQAAAKDLQAQQAAPLPPTGYTGPHARLLGMIKGLALGMDALGTSIATRGKDGGVQEVAQVEGEQQQQKIQAQQAAQAASNAKVQQDLSVINTNQAVGQQIHALATLQDEMDESHMRIAEGRTTVAQGQLNLQSDAYSKFLGGQLSPSQYHTIVNQVPGEAGKMAAASATGGIPATAISTWEKPILDATTGAYKDDPGIKSAAADFDKAKALASTDADAAAQGMYQAGLRATNIADALTKGTASRVAATNADKAVAEAAAAKIKTDQDQLAQNTYNRTVAKNAQGQPVEDFATWQARSTKAAETAVTQGDPSTMGAMAADGLLTIPQIALGRQLDKEGLQKLFKGADDEAKRLGMPEVVVNGKPTGHYFNANAATQQYQYVSEFNNPNSKTQQSISSGNTFINHAADLHDLAQNFTTTNSPWLNTPLNKLKAKGAGDAEITRINAAIQPVITEYKNALAAGFAPTAEDQEAANTILNNSSNVGQIDAATQQMTHSILRRFESTDQGYLSHAGQHYPNMLTPDAKTSSGKLGLDSGDLQSGGSFAGTPQVVNAGSTSSTAPKAPAPPTGATGKAPGPDGKFYYHDAQGRNLGLVP